MSTGVSSEHSACLSCSMTFEEEGGTFLRNVGKLQKTTRNNISKGTLQLKFASGRKTVGVLVKPGTERTLSDCVGIPVIVVNNMTVA